MKNIFYVYVWFRPWNGAPCWVGKGQGNRWLGFDRGSNHHINRIVAKGGGELPAVIVRRDLSEADAFETEMALIKSIGRGKHGPLANLTDGGEGPSGMVHSENTKKKMRALKLKQYSCPEARELISLRTKEAMARPEVKANTSAAQIKRFTDPAQIAAQGRTKGRKLSPEHRAAIGRGLVGGKRTLEQRAKMSAWQIGRKMSDEARLNMSIAAKKRWA